MEMMAKKKKMEKKKKKKIDRDKKTPTKTFILDDGTPLRVEISFTVGFEYEFPEKIKKTGYLSKKSIVHDDSVVLSENVNGFPFIEIPENCIEYIEFVNPESVSLASVSKINNTDKNKPL